MKRIEQVIIDAIWCGVVDFEKENYINDIETLNELNEQIDIEFGVNLSSLSKTEQNVWYYIHNYVYRLNNKVDIEDLIKIGHVCNMTYAMI